MNLKRLTAGILAMLAIAACKEETPYMELSQKKFTIGEEGGRINVELKANVYYRVVNENDFVTISAEGNDAETANYIIDVKANENIDARKARIKFIGDRVTPLALDITQKGKVPVGVDVSELNVSFSATSAEFRVLGDKGWTATCDNPDFVLSKTSGVGESKVEVTFPANTKEAPVTAVVTVTIGGQDYTLTITQEAAPAKERTDLGADGTSNCYIVSKPGYYKFKATVRGNGTLPESCDGEITVSITPDHADVLWCTYNTMTAPTAAAEIIPAVALNGDYIEFETPMNDITPANAIIAAYAADNTILWTWHIWFTDEPAVSDLGGTVWMDRNLGATCPNIAGDTRSSGFLYQWGRKDPMRGAGNTSADFIATTPELTEEQAEVKVDEATGTIAASIKNPRPFINTFPDGAGPKDWIFTADHNDRWQDARKTMFDPCPAGYKVPSNAQWCAFAEAGGLPAGSTKYSKNPDAKAAYQAETLQFATAAWSLPIAGMLSHNNGCALTDFGVAARYESSTAEASPSALYLNANASASNFSNKATRGHAGAVRCVKE